MTDHITERTEPMQSTQDVTVRNELGLHARPAARFVEEAKRFQADVQVHAGEKGGNAKSLISVLSLGVSKDTDIRIVASGADAEEAVAGLVDLLRSLEDEAPAEASS